MSFLLFFLTIAGVSIILSSILFTPIPLRIFLSYSSIDMKKDTIKATTMYNLTYGHSISG